MAVTWEVVSLDATKTVGSLSDVVTTLHWTANDADGDHVGSAYGSVGLAAADSGSFTAYKDITKANAIAWAKAAIGSDEVQLLKQELLHRLQNQKHLL